MDFVILQCIWRCFNRNATTKPTTIVSYLTQLCTVHIQERCPLYHGQALVFPVPCHGMLCDALCQAPKPLSLQQLALTLPKPTTNLHGPPLDGSYPDLRSWTQQVGRVFPRSMPARRRSRHIRKMDIVPVALSGVVECNGAFKGRKWVSQLSKRAGKCCNLS